MPAYLTRRAGFYHFRMRVPLDLKKRLGRSEVHLTLRTGGRRLAKAQAIKLSSALRDLFRELREGFYDDMTDTEIQNLVNAYIRSVLDEDEKHRVMGHGRQEVSQDFPGWSGMKHFLRDELGKSNNKLVAKDVAKLIEMFGVDVEPDSFDYHKLSRELMKRLAKAWEVIEHRDMGDYDFEQGLFPAASASVHQRPHVDCGGVNMPAPVLGLEEMLSSVITRYWERELPRMSEASRKEFKNHTALFLEVVGDIPMRTIDHSVCRDFADAQEKIPSGWKKKKIYRDLTVHELLERSLPEKDKKTPRTILNTITNVSTFLKWAVKQGFIVQNFMDGKAPVNARAPYSTRSPYSQQDLNAIFLSKEYLEDGFEHPYQFWLPLLGLFTGARLEELCQLHVEDIRLIADVWCIDINDDGIKRLKNFASKRILPLHQALVEVLKFPEWVERQRQAGHARIFPELEARYSGKLGHAASKWYSAYRVRNGCSQCFHALRNTFANTCKQRNLDRERVAEYLGHKAGGMTYGHYAPQFNPFILLDNVVGKIAFPISLDHLRTSRFVKS